MNRRIIPAVLMLGAISQIAQVLLMRELLMVFQGNELSIGIILASWMIWVGLGSFLGGFIAEKFNSSLIILKLTVIDILIFLPGTIFLIRNLRRFFNILPGTYLSLLDITLSCFLVMIPVCLLIGIQFVLLAKLWRLNMVSQDTLSAGKTYTAEAAGNMLGGIAFTLIMVRYLNPFESAVFVTVLMFIAFFAIVDKSISKRENKISNSFIILIISISFLIFVFPYLENIDSWAYRIQWKNFNPYYNLIDVQHSKHGTISVAERQGQYSFFQSGHLIFSTAGPDISIIEMEEQDAVTFAHFSILQHKKPKNILLIGGGLRGTISEIIRYPIKKIDYIELDEVLTKLARPYVSKTTLEALNDPRVRTIHTDGRLFIKTAEEKYDMIIIDVPDPSTAVLNRYYTKEFFKETKNILNSDGVLVIATVSTPDLRGTAIANRNTTIYHTLRSVFSNVIVAGERFMFYLASDSFDRVTVDVSILYERFYNYSIKTDKFSPAYFKTFLSKSQLRRINWIVRNHGREYNSHIKGPMPGPLNPGSIQEQQKTEKKLLPVNSHYFINSDFKPIGYYYTLMFWEQLTRTQDRGTFRHIMGFDFRLILLATILLPLILVLLLRILSSIKNKKIDICFAVLFAVFTTGLSTMALQIALIFSFQNIYGFVYEIVGIIIAFFMCGLALGAYWSNKYIKNKTNLNILALVQIIITFFAGLTAIILPVIAQIHYPVMIFVLFSILTFIAGLVNGLDFPLAVACYKLLNKPTEQSVGIIYGVELFGACLGAVFASVFVVPIVGISASCFFAAVASSTAFLVVLISRRSII